MTASDMLAEMLRLPVEERLKTIEEDDAAIGTIPPLARRKFKRGQDRHVVTS